MRSFLLICGVLGLLAFVNPEPVRKLPSTKEIEKDMVRIGPKLYISRYECTNEWYNRFLEHQSPNPGYRNLLPDTVCWRTYFPLSNLSSFYRQYFSNKVYSQYPVMSVSYESALAYCKWLTESYATGKGKIGKKVIFSLPTKEEWMASATYAKDTMFPWKGSDLRAKNGVYHANYRCVMEEAGQLKGEDVYYLTNYAADGYLVPAPVKTYNSNGRGLYQMSGNVSEMLETPGQHAGGGWDSPGFMVALKAPDQYSGITGPHPCVGFRVVARVLE